MENAGFEAALDSRIVLQSHDLDPETARKVILMGVLGDRPLPLQARGVHL